MNYLLHSESTIPERLHIQEIKKRIATGIITPTTHLSTEVSPDHVRTALEFFPAAFGQQSATVSRSIPVSSEPRHQGLKIAAIVTIITISVIAFLFYHYRYNGTFYSGSNSITLGANGRYLLYYGGGVSLLGKEGPYKITNDEIWLNGDERDAFSGKAFGTFKNGVIVARDGKEWEKR